MKNDYIQNEFKFYEQLIEFLKHNNIPELKELVKNEISEKIRLYQEIELIEHKFPKIFDIANARKTKIAYLSKLLKKL